LKTYERTGTRNAFFNYYPKLYIIWTTISQ